MSQMFKGAKSRRKGNNSASSEPSSSSQIGQNADQMDAYKFKTSSSDEGFYGTYGSYGDNPISAVDYEPTEPTAAQLDEAETAAPADSADATSAEPESAWAMPAGSAAADSSAEQESDFDLGDIGGYSEEADNSSAANILQFDEEDDSLSVPSDVSDAEGDEYSLQETRSESKSMDYEDTVSVNQNGQPYSGGLGNSGNVRKVRLAPTPMTRYKPDESAGSAPKKRSFIAIASGTPVQASELPGCEGDECYVKMNYSQFRRLKTRNWRGLGVLATLCLVIIAAFCIWSYSDSISDPLLGKWKGTVESQDLQIAALSQLGEDSFSSTWEFSSGGSLYLSLVINETPVSLSGSYEKLADDAGEQYLAMTVNNPLDGVDYTLNMYYTVTGDVLIFSDMQELGIDIELSRD